MKMKYKNKARFLPAVLLLAVIVLLGAVLAPRFLTQLKVVQSFQNNAKDKKIAELQARMAQIVNKEDEEYKAVRREFCNLSARPESERAKAVANIREFLHGIYPAVGKKFEPEFICSRFNGKPDDTGTDYNNPAVEFYEAENHSFEVDPKTNYIIGVGDAERTKRSDPLPNYDYSGIYSKPDELRQVAERFLTDHKNILGIDITKMTYQYEGTKPGNFFMHWTDKNVSVTKEHEVCGDVDKTLEGVYKNEQGALCVKQKSTNYHQVDITITNGGQIIVYRNNINDLDKL